MEIDVKTYNGTHESVKSAIELSDGFNNLKTGDSLVLKPNIFRGGGLFHKSILQYGPVTTSRIIKDTIISLKEYRWSKIAIGEVTVIDKSLYNLFNR